MHSCVRKVLVAKVGSKLIFLINGIKHFGSQFWLKIKSKFVYYPLKNQPTNQTVFGLIIYADFDNLVWRYTFSPFINTPPLPPKWKPGPKCVHLCFPLAWGLRHVCFCSHWWEGKSINLMSTKFSSNKIWFTFPGKLCKLFAFLPKKY